MWLEEGEDQSLVIDSYFYMVRMVMKTWKSYEILKQPFPGLEKFIKSHGILFHKSQCNRVIFNQVLNMCVYRIVLLIPAAFEFIMREIPANIIEYSM